MAFALVKLKECSRVVSGGTPSREVAAFWNGNIRWVTPKDLSALNNIYISDTPECITEAGLKNSSAEILPPNSVLFSSRAPIGHIAINTVAMCTNQGFKSFIPSDNVDSKYLYFCLKYLTPQIEALGNGATFKEVSKKTIEDFEIPLPPFPIQRHIARVLDQADQLRKQAQQMETELNALAQAVFLEMFGDLARNSKNFDQFLLNDLAINSDGIKCGPFGTQLGKNEFTDNGIALWGIKHVNRGFINPTHEYVTLEKAQELDTYSIIGGDIVMTRKGTVGNCHVYPYSFTKGIMHSDLLRIRVDSSKVLPEFLAWQFKLSQSVIKQVESVSTGAIMAGINVTKLKNIVVHVPPMNLQNKFLSFLLNNEKQLNKARTNIKFTNTLFHSLVQKAFKGELIPTTIKDAA